MEPQSTQPSQDATDRPYTPASVALIIAKAIAIAAALVFLASYGTRIAMALMPP